MKIELMSGQPDVEINNKFAELLQQNGYNITNTEHVMIYPELELKQQKIVYDTVRQQIAFHINQQKDIFILTYSDHVLNALRLEIKRHEFKGAKVHQILNDGTDVITNISNDGKLDVWCEDIFDVWDKALDELV